MDDPNVTTPPADQNAAQPAAQPVDPAAAATPNQAVAADALNNAPLDKPAAPAGTAMGAPTPPPSADPLATPPAAPAGDDQNPPTPPVPPTGV